MRAPELLSGLRVVAEPTAIDAAQLPAGATMLRIAPDDAIVVGAATLTLDDPFAIVEPELRVRALAIDTCRVRRRSHITSNGRFQPKANSARA